MLPDGIIPVDTETVQVTIGIVPVTATRAFEVGLQLVGARSDRAYATSTDRVLVTVGGSVATLDEVDGATLVADLDVTSLDTGTADVPVTIRLPAGLTLVSASPATVAVTATIPVPASPAAVRLARREPERLTAMSRLFGTDGIRGVANVDLKPTLAYALGRATAHRLAGAGGTIVVGQDTRRSGDMFVAAITAGATSLGVDVHVVGVVPTPALAYLARNGDHAAGIMVSASHNPADDNGLKVLDADGLKLDDAIEEELEQLIWREGELGGVGNATLGRRIDAADAVDAYRTHRLGLAATIPAGDPHRARRGERVGRGAGRGDPGRDRRTGRGRSTSNPMAATSTSTRARRPRRHWPRRSWPAAPTSGSPSTAMPTG